MTTRTEKAAAGMLAGVQAGHAQARLDKRLAADAARARDVDMMPLADVQGRLGGLDTREPTPEALDAMTESLDALGLVEPLAVDKLGRLLAGKTRLLALRRLAAKDPDRWGKVPVRRMDFDAEADPARALAVEVAENEQRRDYTPAEVRALAERLRGAGYRESGGRPRKGEKALRPALELVLGVSKNTARRLLGRMDAPGKGAHVGTFSLLARLHRPVAALAGADLPPGERLPALRRAVGLARMLSEALPDALAEAETLQGKDA